MTQVVSAAPSRAWVRQAALGAGVVAAVAVASTSDTEDGPVLCPFRLCTGAYCPGCGGTRAAGQLLRGDFVGSWQRHPYVVVLAVQLAVLAALAASVRGRERIRARWVSLLVANSVFLVGLWVLRLGLGDIPSVHRPW